MREAEHLTSAAVFACVSCILMLPPAASGLSGDSIEAAPGQWIEDELVLALETSSIEIDPTQICISGWELDPTASGEKKIKVKVRADMRWELAVADTDPITAGYLTEWDGSAYLDRKLLNPLKIGAENEVLLSSGGVIQDGEGSREEEVEITIKQEVEWEDEPLPGDHVYRVILTFVGSQAA